MRIESERGIKLSERSTVILALLWEGGDPSETEAGNVGIQDKRGDLTAPVDIVGDVIRFEIEATVISSQSWTELGGSYVHGRRGERFLYLSFRDPTGLEWRRRLKILIPPALSVSVSKLTVRFRDSGGSRAELTSEWVST